MKIYATSNTLLLRLIAIDIGDKDILFGWYDPDDPPYQLLGGRTWAGTDGWCAACRWALDSGYRLDGDNVERAG